MLDKSKTYLIVGLGLLGGKYAQVLSQKGYNVTGITHSQSTLDYALQHDYIRAGKNADFEDLVREADCIIFVAHWGTEDETMPNEYEKQWAAFLMQQGVDVIIGGHPHVLQPYGQLSDDQGHNTTIFYSLGNFVSTQQELPELLEGMASFTIQKSTLNGKSTIQILSPEVKPMVMHYNHDNGEYGPYMLDDYTEELASSHSVRNVIGDEFTLDNLKAKFKEIMSMNVKPSTNTNLLNVKFDWEGNMIDKTTGNVVEDTESIHSWEYQADTSDGTEDSSDSSDSSSDESSDDSSNEYDSGY